MRIDIEPRLLGVITNGDVMKALFDISLDDFIHMWGGGEFTEIWWNAPYKKGRQDEEKS